MRELILILIISCFACLACVKNAEYLRKLYGELWSPQKWRRVEIVDERSTFEEFKNSYWDYMEMFVIGLMVCVVSSITGCWTYSILRGRTDKEHQKEHKKIKERLQEMETCLREGSWYRNRLQDIGNRIKELDEHVKCIENKYVTTYSNPGCVESINYLVRDDLISRECECCDPDTSLNTYLQENESVDFNCTTTTDNTTGELETETTNLHNNMPKKRVEKLNQTEEISPMKTHFDNVDPKPDFPRSIESENSFSTTNRQSGDRNDELDKPKEPSVESFKSLNTDPKVILKHDKDNHSEVIGMVRNPTNQKRPKDPPEHEETDKCTDLRDTDRLVHDVDNQKISDDDIEPLQSDTTHVHSIITERPNDILEAKSNLKIEETPSAVKILGVAGPKPVSARSLDYKMSYTQLGVRCRIPQYQKHHKEAKPDHKTATYSERYKETSNKDSPEIQSRPNTACGDYAQSPSGRQRKRNQKGYASCKTNN